MSTSSATGSGGAIGGGRGRLFLLLALTGAGWLAYDRDMLKTLVATPRRFIAEIQAPTWGGPQEMSALYAWIRTSTPRDSIFVTPHLMDFWSYAERAQVATLRQSPLDQRLLEWKERLETLKGATPFRTRGEQAFAEFDQGEGRLKVDQLLEIRTRYGATHYLVDGVRRDLAAYLAYSADGYSIYDLAALRNKDPGAGTLAIELVRPAKVDAENAQRCRLCSTMFASR